MQDDMMYNDIKNNWKRTLKKEYCNPKDIRRQIAELRRDKKLPESKKDYRPNIKGIQHEFLENASEVKAVMAENALDDLNSKETDLPTCIYRVFSFSS